MLPPGHIAAGYLTSKVVISSLHYSLTSHQVKVLALLGTFIAFAPDLDFFYAFAKSKSFTIENDVVIHRKFLSHVPLVWLLAGLAVFFLAASPFYKALGLLIWLCSWSHFILDSEWGIMWLWPFKKRFYPFSEEYYQEKYAFDNNPKEKTFFKYWWALVKSYYMSKSGILEIITILIALTLVAK
jgi:hypothetical protein